MGCEFVTDACFRLSYMLTHNAPLHASPCSCRQVVSACMTHSQRDLLLWCRVAAAGQEPDSFPFFSCHVSVALPGRAEVAGQWYK